MYCTVLLLHCTVLLLYCTILYCTVLYCTVLYCTVQYLSWKELLALLEHFRTGWVLTPLLQSLLLEVFNDLHVGRGDLLQLGGSCGVGGVSENLFPEECYQ